MTRLLEKVVTLRFFPSYFRFYKLLNNGLCEVIPFTVPRKVSDICATSRENLSSAFLTRSDTNRAVQPQKMSVNCKRMYTKNWKTTSGRLAPEQCG